MTKKNTFGLFLLSVLEGWMAWFVPREQFLLLMGLYGLAFGIYLWLVQQDLSEKVVFWLGVSLRLIVLFSLPQLSNDVYRFIWDGRLLVAGQNPFALRPSEWMAMSNPPVGINQELHNLTYADNYTVYPPIHQAVFWMSAKLSSSIFGAVLVLKSVLVLGEIAMLWFLRKAKEFAGLSVFYALNPLVILEIAGNGHFEGLMVLFLILGIYGLRKKDGRLAGIGIGLSIATKLLPLMLLPLIGGYFWGNVDGQKKIALDGDVGMETNGRSSVQQQMYLLLGWAVGINMVLWLPFFWMGSLNHLMDSIWLYFESFEFNASVFYLLKWLAPNNWRIGLVTNVLTVGVIVWLTLRQRVMDERQLVKNMTLVWSVYLLNSAIVHPWYVLPVFVLSVMSKQWLGVIWSGLIYLSYSHYWGGAMDEHYDIIVLEYILLLIAAGMLRRTGCWRLDSSC